MTTLKQYKLIAREPTFIMLDDIHDALLNPQMPTFPYAQKIFEAGWDAAPNIETEAEKYMRARLFEADNFDLDVVPVSREQIRALLRERGKV